MRTYEPWRALRNLDVPDGARERLLDGIEEQRTRSGRRGYVLVGAFVAAGVALLFILRAAPGTSEVAESVAPTEESPHLRASAAPSAPAGELSIEPAGAPGERSAPAGSPSERTAPTPESAPESAPALTPESAPASDRAPTPAPKRTPRSSMSRSTFANSRHDTQASISGDELDLGATALRRQIRAFRAARELAPTPALAAWHKHRRRWPSSTLRREVDLAVINALRQLDRHIEARGEAAAFVRAHPDDRRSPSLRRFAEGL